MGLQTAKEVQQLHHKKQSVWPEMQDIKQLAQKTLAHTAQHRLLPGQ